MIFVVMVAGKVVWAQNNDIFTSSVKGVAQVRTTRTSCLLFVANAVFVKMEV